MVNPLLSLSALSTLVAGLAVPQAPLLGAQAPLTNTASGSEGGVKGYPRPLVIWHGLGDQAHSKGIDEFIGDIRTRYPGIYVHSIVSPLDGSPQDEQRAGWWGSAEQLAEEQCDALAKIKDLENGYDAMGFSQGGLFLRYIAQYCEHGDKMKNLITFGTPHYGINALIPCPNPPTLACRLADRAARSGIYTQWAQQHLIQAQYYRDVDRLDEFLLQNTFLRDLNGEGILDDLAPEAALEALTSPGTEGSGREYGGRGLQHLENLVAVNFLNDTTVYPARSSQWATLVPGGGDELNLLSDDAEEQSPSESKLPVAHDITEQKITELRDQPLYEQDWIGLKALDKKKRLHLVDCPGEHMQLGGEGGCADRLVGKWVGWNE